MNDERRRPDLEGQWYKFDDERVTKETESKATEEQFGGEDETPLNPGFNNPPAFKYTKHSNAYMLVYIRKEDKDRIICPVTNDDIAAHLQERFMREQEEKERKKKEKSEAHLFTILKVARDADLKAHIGNELYFDLVDHDKVRRDAFECLVYQSQSLNRNKPRPPTNHSPSIGINLAHRPITAPR